MNGWGRVAGPLVTYQSVGIIYCPFAILGGCEWKNTSVTEKTQSLKWSGYLQTGIVNWYQYIWANKINELLGDYKCKLKAIICIAIICELYLFVMFSLRGFVLYSRYPCSLWCFYCNCEQVMSARLFKGRSSSSAFGTINACREASTSVGMNFVSCQWMCIVVTAQIFDV